MHKAVAADDRPGEVSGEFFMTEIASTSEGKANRRGRLKNTNGVTQGTGEGPSDGYVASMANAANGAVMIMLIRARTAIVTL